MTNKKFSEGIILSNNRPLAVGLTVWQSLIQLSRSKSFFERYDLYCRSYVREENVKKMLQSDEGWHIGAALAKALQFNGTEVKLSGRYGKRAAILVNFKTHQCCVVTREPTKTQAKHIKKCHSKMNRVPLIIHSAEDFKARIYQTV